MNLSLNFARIKKKLKHFFLRHRYLSYTIALFFICCCIYVDYKVISNTYYKIKKIEHREGVVSYWDRTSGEFNEATLKIINDTNIYKTQRYGGWLCFQHNGKREETVSFYTVKHEVGSRAGEYPYYGLSEKDNPRSQFWIFFDVLFSCYTPVLIWCIIGFVGTILFNLQIIRNRFLLPLSIVVLSVSLLMFITASIS